MVALDLYNAFVRESSQNARFLTLTLALEALLPKGKKPEYAIRMIDRWLGEVNDERSVAKLDSEEAAVYESLKGGLESQKNVSINAKVRVLVRETLARHGDKDASDVAARAVKLYGRRSILVHTGLLPVEKLTESTAELKSIMQRVLTARFIEVTGRARDNSAEVTR